MFSHITPSFLQEIETEYNEWINKELNPLKSTNPMDIGSDNNTIGLFTIALGLVNKVINLHKNGQPLYRHKKVKKKLEMIKNHIKSVQKKRDTASDIEKVRLYEYEYQLLHKSIARIRTETKREAMRIFAFVVKYLKIKYIGVDDISGLNNRGKKGKLANAITDLGKSQEYFSYFHELIEDISC